MMGKVESPAQLAAQVAALHAAEEGGRKHEHEARKQPILQGCAELLHTPPGFLARRLLPLVRKRANRSLRLAVSQLIGLGK